MGVDIYSSVYKKLNTLIPNLKSLEVDGHGKSSVRGLMDLSYDVLERKGAVIRLALSHYYSQGGDKVADPDMEIRVYLDREMAEALTYQDSFRYEEVYPEPGKVYPKLKKSLNGFLNTWLRNCIKQGHLFANG